MDAWVGGDKGGEKEEEIRSVSDAYIGVLWGRKGRFWGRRSS